MEDPYISSYPKPLTLKEKYELVPVNFDDLDYVVAFKYHLADKKSRKTRPIRQIPPELGSIKASILDLSTFN